MKKFTWILIFLPFAAFMQETNETPKLTFKSISILGGASDYNTVSSLSDFKKLATESQFVNTDFSAFGSGKNREKDANFTTVYFNFSLNSDKKFFASSEQSLRFGISFGESTPLSKSYSNKENYRVDTLVSNQNGDEVFIDSIHQEHYRFKYNQQQVYLSSAYLIHTNSGSRFSFYAGLEMGFGVTLNANTEISYSAYNYIENYYNKGAKDSKEYVRKTESFRNKSSFMALASIPLGIDFRFGNRRAFWKRLHLIAEYRPSIYFVSIPEIGTISGTSYIGSGGLRFDF